MYGVGWDTRGPVQDPAWQEMLNRLAPRTERGHEWLLIRWEPGESWNPIERWMIWTMIPERFIPPDRLRLLSGPDPRSLNRLDAAGRGFLVHDSTIGINYQQWLLFREYRCLAQPFWIVQGRGGGHKRKFSDTESGLSLMAGGPPQPPLAGELPYAEPDRRTWQQLERMDRVRLYGDLLERLTDDPLKLHMLNRRERETARTLAKALSYWLDEQIGECMDLTRTQAQLLQDADIPRPSRPLDRDDVERDFVDHIERVYS